MRNIISKMLPVILCGYVMLSLASCELIGDIFEAGVWVGVIIVVAILALLIFLFRKK